MKRKKGLIFHCIILMLFCQVCVPTADAVSEEKLQTISTHCEKIRESLRLVQREDSVVRTHLGPYYNTVLEKFMKPLNLRLVENNISEQRLFNNQQSFATTQNQFRDDYRAYQDALGDLVAMDCKNEPEKFYAKLEETREKRKVVATEVAKMRKLAGKQVTVLKEVLEKL